MSVRSLRLPFSSLFLAAVLVAAPAFANFPGGIGPSVRDPEQPGPFGVGYVTLIEYDASRDRTFQMDVWYPVEPEDAVGAPGAYDLLFAALESERAIAAAPPSGQGPFSLIAFSHGNNGIRFQSAFLAEQLASHGFVVAAPDHVGNTAIDLLIPGQSFEVSDRPLDIQFVITRMLERSADPMDDFFGLVDPGRIGVAGHSFGGFTTLAIGSGFLAVPPDPRVLALLPISPASSGLSDTALASIFLPTLILGGTNDITTPVEPQSARPFALIPGRPLYRVDIQGAGHNSFTDICAIGEALIDAGLPMDLLGFLLGNLAEGCGPDLIPIGEAQRISNRYAVSFLKSHVAGDMRYDRFFEIDGEKNHKGVDFFVATGCGGGPGGIVFAGMLLFVARAAGGRRR
ncbi:MAG: hypothetical protein HKP30_07455 [Myxococcales bacterium]|nr:hypothetical protein [Myxococcales bacterium]